MHSVYSRNKRRQYKIIRDFQFKFLILIRYINNAFFKYFGLIPKNANLFSQLGSSPFHLADDKSTFWYLHAQKRVALLDSRLARCPKQKTRYLGSIPILELLNSKLLIHGHFK